MFLLVDREKGFDLFDCAVPYTEPITQVSLCLYIYVFVCVCACVCVWLLMRIFRDKERQA